MVHGLVIRVPARLEPCLTSAAIGTNSRHYYHPHFNNREMKLRKVMQPAQSHTGSKQLNQNSGWSAHLASKHIHFGPVTNMATLNLLWATEPPWIYIRKKLPDFPNGTVVRILLLMQGTWVWSLVWVDPTCHRATKPMHPNYWDCFLELAGCKTTSPRAYALC